MQVAELRSAQAAQAHSNEQLQSQVASLQADVQHQAALQASEQARAASLADEQAGLLQHLQAAQLRGTDDDALLGQVAGLQQQLAQAHSRSAEADRLAEERVAGLEARLAEAAREPPTAIGDLQSLQAEVRTWGGCL